MAPKTKATKYVIDCTIPVNDNIIDITSFEKYLQDRIKVEGKTGVLGDKVVLTRTESLLTVEVRIPFSKRYLKYLTKKYLKKQQLRDFIHVIAPDASTYTLKYFNIAEEQEE